MRTSGIIRGMSQVMAHPATVTITEQLTRLLTPGAQHTRGQPGIIGIQRVKTP